MWAEDSITGTVTRHFQGSGIAGEGHGQACARASKWAVLREGMQDKHDIKKKNKLAKAGGQRQEWEVVSYSKAFH